VVSFTLAPPGKEPLYPLDRFRTGVDDVEKRNFCLYRDSNSDLSVVQPVASLYIDFSIPAPRLII
jgi:hypothetical protein